MFYADSKKLILNIEQRQELYNSIKKGVEQPIKNEIKNIVSTIDDKILYSGKKKKKLKSNSVIEKYGTIKDKFQLKTEQWLNLLDVLLVMITQDIINKSKIQNTMPIIDNTTLIGFVNTNNDIINPLEFLQYLLQYAKNNEESYKNLYLAQSQVLLQLINEWSYTWNVVIISYFELLYIVYNTIKDIQIQDKCKIFLLSSSYFIIIKQLNIIISDYNLEGVIIDEDINNTEYSIIQQTIVARVLIVYNDVLKYVTNDNVTRLLCNICNVILYYCINHIINYILYTIPDDYMRVNRLSIGVQQQMLQSDIVSLIDDIIPLHIQKIFMNSLQLQKEFSSLLLLSIDGALNSQYLSTRFTSIDEDTIVSVINQLLNKPTRIDINKNNTSDKILEIVPKEWQPQNIFYNFSILLDISQQERLKEILVNSCLYDILDTKSNSFKSIKYLVEYVTDTNTTNKSISNVNKNNSKRLVFSILLYNTPIYFPRNLDCLQSPYGISSIFYPFFC